MTPVDAGAHSEHVKVIWCNIKRSSVEKSWHAENGTISEEKNLEYYSP
jgi:hypothetical protein